MIGIIMIIQHNVIYNNPIKDFKKYLKLIVTL